MEFFSAVLGWSTIPLAIARFQVRDFNAGLYIGAIAAWLTAAHLALIEANAGAISALAVALTMSLQAAMGAHLAPAARYAIATAAIAVALYIKEAGAFAFLPLIAFATTRLVEASRHDLLLRLTMLGATILWVIYALMSGSWSIAIGNVIAVLSNLIGLWRFYGTAWQQSAAFSPVYGRRSFRPIVWRGTGTPAANAASDPPSGPAP